MQLKGRPAVVRRGLIAASCALLGSSGARGQEAVTSGGGAETDGGQIDWLFDSALAYYHENGRVQAIEPVVNIRIDDGVGESINFNLTYDSLSGSSPNGALPSNKPQTFASPSGKSLSAAPHTYTSASGQTSVESAPIYTTSPGQLPVDPKYHDQRLAVGGSWQMPWSRLTRASIGGKVSYEHDFLSLAANASIAHDFNPKNTTLSLGINGESDVKENGGCAGGGTVRGSGGLRERCVEGQRFRKLGSEGCGQDPKGLALDKAGAIWRRRQWCHGCAIQPARQ